MQLNFYKKLVTTCATTATVMLALPHPVEACGGFFCDGGGPPMPVDQTGENILFVVDDQAGTVAAHIQIQYVGEPQNFAWIIPVTALPEFSVGSEQLFQNLLSSTVPTYALQGQLDCQEMQGPMGGGCAPGFGRFAAEDGGDFDSAGAISSGTSGQETGGTQVLAREIVGAFYIDVLQSNSATELYEWLEQNGYAQDAEAPEIVQEYLDEGHLFAAVKLNSGANLDEIHPLVMTYQGDEPCVPLRLTRIAAVEDMGVRTFFLGSSRAVPSNYKHVELNDAVLDWVNFAANYNDVVTLAVDEAGGRAFVTEYAGQSSVVPGNYYNPQWAAGEFDNTEHPIISQGYTIIDALAGQGLLECSFDPCQYYHPLIASVLREFLPAPEGMGISESEYYRNLGQFSDLIDLEVWDPVAFSDALRERIKQPAQHAETLLQRWPYLTRMYTTISPHEMLVDPMFHVNPDLPDVANNRQADQFFPCEGSNKIVFDDERELLLNEDGNWPVFDGDIDMPFAKTIAKAPPSGALMVEEDNGAKIDEALEASNARYNYDNGTLGCTAARVRKQAAGWLSLGLIGLIAWRSRRRR